MASDDRGHRHTVTQNQALEQIAKVLAKEEQKKQQLTHDLLQRFSTNTQLSDPDPVILGPDGFPARQHFPPWTPKAMVDEVANEDLCSHEEQRRDELPEEPDTASSPPTSVGMVNIGRGNSSGRRTHGMNRVGEPGQSQANRSGLLIVVLILLAVVVSWLVLRRL